MRPAAFPPPPTRALPSAKAEVPPVLRNLDLTAFDGVAGARAAPEAGGDTFASCQEPSRVSPRLPAAARLC
jgi:hypothetical protein